jgi:hypothetical protein
MARSSSTLGNAPTQLECQGTSVPDIHDDVNRFADEVHVSNGIDGCVGVQPVVVPVEHDYDVQWGLSLCYESVTRPCGLATGYQS